MAESAVAVAVTAARVAVTAARGGALVVLRLHPQRCLR